MSQYDFGTIDPAAKTGTALATDLNSWRTAVHSGHKGSSEPTYALAGMLWVDDTSDPTWALKLHDGTDNITLFNANTTTNRLNWEGLSYSIDDGTNDYIWEINSTNLRLRDVTNTKNPFVVEPNAQNNQVYLDSTGAVGILGAPPTVNADVFLMSSGVLALVDRASAPTADSGYGKIWSDSNTPFMPKYQDPSAGSAFTFGMLETQQAWTKPQYYTPSALTSGTTVTWDLSTEPKAKITLAHNVGTLTLSNPVTGGEYSIEITQDGAGGAHTVAWPASVTWPSGTAPVITTTNNAVDIVTLECVDDSTPVYRGNFAQDYS